MGLSPSLALPALLWDAAGAMAGVGATWTLVVDAVREMASEEFFLVFVPEAAVEAAPFFDLEPEVVPGTLDPEPRFRFLITSVFKLKGLTTPWSFKKRPQALQRG